MNKYKVDIYGSDPMLENDDCWTGKEFEGYDQALHCFEFPEEHFKSLSSCTFIMLESPTGLYSQRRIAPDPKTEEGVDKEWQRELAREAGMLHGCGAYNDMMGCPLGGPEEH